MNAPDRETVGSCTLRIDKGVCVVLFAYDIGFSIDLDAAEHALGARPGDGAAQREYLRHTRKSPRSVEYRPAPLRVSRRGAKIPVASFETDENVYAVAYDFGAVSIAYTIPLRGGAPELLALTEALYENQQLLEDSRRQADALAAMLGGAVQQPRTAPLVEDYVVLHLEQAGWQGPAGAVTPAEWLRTWRTEVTHILRSERGSLSSQEVDDATGTCISYALEDAGIVDWNAALLLGPDMEDAIAVLEFANVELLEMRLLDDQLDRALERAYTATTRRARAYPPRTDRASLREIAELQVSGAMLFEGVNNTLKLLGDQYLARLYRAALNRFHLPDWDASILRKLATLESIYDKLNDRQTTHRTEVLEWIVILLIAFEVVAAWLWPALRAWLG